MPTHYKAQLIEAEPAMVETLNRMSEGVAANARQILGSLRYYSRRSLPIPDQDADLTSEEKLELEPIVNALASAAITSDRMKDGVLVATLQRVAKDPLLFWDGQLPAAVQWELATDYQRDKEKPGTFGLDIWGDEQAIAGYQFQTPNEANIKNAAEAALARIKKVRTSGRPQNWANKTVALDLGKIFRSSGYAISRGRQPHMSGKKLVFFEGGPFFDFLGLVLPTLNLYLCERGSAPVTAETIVRLVTEVYS